MPILTLRPDVVPLLIGVGLFSYLIFTGYRFRHSRLGIDFILLMVLACFWQISASLSVLSTTQWLIKILTTVSVACITGIPVLVVLFTGHLTRRQWMTNRSTIILISIMPVLTVILTATNDLHHIVYSTFRFQVLSTGYYLSPIYETWYTVSSAYSYLLMLIVVINLIEWYQKAAPVSRGHTKIMWLGMIPPVVANILYTSGLINTIVDPTPLAFSISGFFILWGLLRYGLPDVIPIAREIVFESIRDGVIVLDSQEIVIDINPAASKLFGGTPAGLIGHSMRDLIRRVKTSLVIVKNETGDYETMRFGKNDQVFDYEVRTSPISDKSGLMEGNVVLLSDVTERRKMEDELKVLSTLDHLTGLMNRRAFFIELGKQIRLAQRYKYQLAVCMMDLDRFKLLNDRYGHQVGDDALTLACSTIQNTIRDSDTVARYGGDELAMLLVHTGERGALTLCKRVAAAVAQLRIRDEFSMGISIGITGLKKEDGDTGETIIARADRALYKAKADGRGGIVVG